MLLIGYLLVMNTVKKRHCKKKKKRFNTQPNFLVTLGRDVKKGITKV